MAIEATVDIEYSGGIGNSDPLESIGGDPSGVVVPPVIENIFGNLEATETNNGIIDYRMIYVNNTGAAAINTLQTSLIYELNTPAQIYLGYFLANELQTFTFSNYPSSGTITFTYTDFFGNLYPLSPITYVSPTQLATDLANQLNNLNDIFGQQILGGVVCLSQTEALGFVLQINFTGESGNKYQNLLTQTNTLNVSVSNASKIIDGSPINTTPVKLGSTLDRPVSTTFFTANPNTPITIGKLLNNPYRTGEGEYLPIWIQRNVPPNTGAQEVAGATLKLNGLVYPPLPTPTSTPEASPTMTPTMSPSVTASPTPTPSESPTPTSTEATVTPTPSPSPSESPTPTPSYSETPLPTNVATFTPTASPSFSATVTPSPTPSPSPEPTPSHSPSPTVTFAPTPTPTRPYTALYMWGVQFQFQLGNRIDTGICSTPIQVGSAYQWTELTMNLGSNFAGGMTTINSLLSWGSNAQGQCGVNNTLNQPAPAAGGGNNWMTNGFSMAAGAAHTLAIRSNSTLWATGYNNKGQLGIGNVINYSSYIMISGNTNWYSVAAGAYTSYGITNAGVLYGWGYNSNGQLGNSSTVDIRTPITIAAGSPLILWVLPTKLRKTIDAWYHTLAIGNNNFLYGWGTNWSGCLGNNSTLDVSKPIFIGTGFYSVSTGASHSAAIMLDYTLWTWGSNSNGQLGLNSTTNYSSPVQVAGSWTSVACSSYATLALKNDGSLWAWGSNTDKVLGVSSTITNISSPMMVDTTIRNWQIVYAGDRAFGAL